MQTFTIEIHQDADGADIVTRDLTMGGRFVIYTGTPDEAQRAIAAVRMAYNYGRRDEAAVRAAAFAGASGATPLSGAA